MKKRTTGKSPSGDGRWRAFDYEDLLKRDKLSLDLFWLRDEFGRRRVAARAQCHRR